MVLDYRRETVFLREHSPRSRVNPSDVQGPSRAKDNDPFHHKGGKGRAYLASFLRMKQYFLMPKKCKRS